MHTRGHASDAAWSRYLKRLAEMMAAEEPRAPDNRCRKDRMIEKARGHPDNSGVRAARSICAKNGWVYDE